MKLYSNRFVVFFVVVVLFCHRRRKESCKHLFAVLQDT